MNRHYSSAQGRFTQVDPIGMSATQLEDPQSLNLYAYCGNDPINQTDPSGLFSWKGVFKFLAFGVFSFRPVRQAVIKVLASKWFQLAIGVLLIILSPPAGAIIFNLAEASQATLHTINVIRGVLVGLQAAGAVSSLVDNKQKKQNKKKEKIIIGGEFLAENLAALNKVIDAAREKLRDETCAAVIGGSQNAESLLNRARPLSSNTINPAYKGTGGRAIFGERAGETVAGTARRQALDPASNNLAYSEIGGRHIYIADRFFGLASESGQLTLYIHELNRINRYKGSDNEDYDRITKACGTERPKFK